MSAVISVAVMGNRRAKPTAADVAAAARLRAAWDERARERGLTQDKMAALMEGSQGLVSQYLNGRIPLNYKALLHFSHALGVDADSIRTDLPEQRFRVVTEQPERSDVPSLPTGLRTERSTARPADEIPSGYVRLGLLDAAGDMGDGAENVDFPEVIREMDLAEVQLRNLIGFMPRPGRLKLMTGRGISMEPVIKSGDVVIVDTGCQHFDGDGIYVINTGSGVQIKALQDRGDGIYVVSANPTFPPYKAVDGLVIGGKVYVRNRLERLD